jgi:phosphoribosylaminoimidazolecarboxamide formyltransferase/IMP cyclohydrolase
MIRAAAKNYLRVGVVTDPADYKSLLDSCREGKGSLSLGKRFELAKKAFKHTARYDRAIADYLDATSVGQAVGAYRFAGE